MYIQRRYHLKLLLTFYVPLGEATTNWQKFELHNSFVNFGSPFDYMHNLLNIFTWGTRLTENVCGRPWSAKHEQL